MDFSNLVGEWNTELSHRLLPGEVIHGRATFELLEGGKFLIVRDKIEHPKFPGASIAIVGADRMHYFDSRGVMRVFEGVLANGAWTFTRGKTSPQDFAQRISWRPSEDGKTMQGLAEIDQDGNGWKEDLQITYRRANAVLT